MKLRILFLLSFLTSHAFAQFTLSGKVSLEGQAEPALGASVYIQELKTGATADTAGNYLITGIPKGTYTVRVSFVSMPTVTEKNVKIERNIVRDFVLKSGANSLDEVVVTGTMKEVSKLDSPVPVDIITSKFIYKNPVPSIFEGLSYVNGVRPQLNCNVCNTGDIHINGLEGPYTMVLIDGMPMVSGLSTVYGLSGIPNSLIDRVEIVKGPASTLYGSEAVGGLINIITKNPLKAPVFSADVFSTTWRDYNVDLGVKFTPGEKSSSLLGINYFNYQNPIDNNKDGFTDLTLQNRISIFNKWSFKLKDDRQANIAARYYYEDRWGGQMQWDRSYRGGDEIYGESIYTKRFELLGNYQLPLSEKVTLQYSFSSHNQNSAYGNVPFVADQKIAFAQLLWDKEIGKHSLLMGTPFRYTFYNDNTPATRYADGHDHADKIYLPGIFIQDEIKTGPHSVLLGARYDYNSRHGSIFTPRAAYKYKFNQTDVVRLNVGRGFRIVNLFTEDHAALTGSRDVILKEELKPEQSWNANINLVKKIVTGNSFIGFDASVFYTHFTNRILPDYDTNPNQIIYDNLNGYAVSKGISLNLDFNFPFPLKIIAGGTYMDNFQKENGVRFRPVLTEKFTGTWSFSYEIQKAGLSVDYTGNIYGPMRLPVLSEEDPRAANSPVWSLQNIQLTKKFNNGLEVYGGVKNLLNFTPPANSIARANDPFDKNVQFDGQGQVIATPDNPYRLTFDPSYVYAPNQGIRAFAGLRYTLR
ncbi:TonB-dependent receptor [Dyadobacter fermentans]|uniref:TonB-dependent receptor plug n=1 Tax=Dyadobacter fermentans (strain ATCC 700827 / DSM 18053 / CIP 107007 / KCTC 52180 / NS114) TaxID=471854 RepID=C6W6C7_DYAFD|nr:TonB-dependent receptor [Dyadobacter fermentans]ACT94267.1 TonB-dependent receptor plug [Dyadobacter fermentans DSM 18053]